MEPEALFGSVTVDRSFTDYSFHLSLMLCRDAILQ